MATRVLALVEHPAAEARGRSGRPAPDASVHPLTA
jgi:hypothetical protein